MKMPRLVGSLRRALASCYARFHRLGNSVASLCRDWRSRHKTFLLAGIMRRLEPAFYRLVIVPLVAFLPAPLAYGVACLRGDLCYRWVTSSRKRIMYSLEGILGNQLSSAERKRVTRDYFRLRSCEAIDAMRLAGRGRALARLVEVRGLEHIEAALAAGKGAILCSGHFGSYLSCSALIGIYGFPITVIGRLLNPEKVDSAHPLERFFLRQVVQKPVERHSRRPFMEPWPGQFGIAVQARAILRQNELIGIYIDPAVIDADRTRAVLVNFLNGQVPLLPGAVTIAKSTGAPVLMAFLRRSEDWRHQVLEVCPPMPLHGSIVTAFERCLAEVEVAIRQDPAHWHYWNSNAPVHLGLLPAEAFKALI